jgi:hypothetical protein
MPRASVHCSVGGSKASVQSGTTATRPGCRAHAGAIACLEKRWRNRYSRHSSSSLTPPEILDAWRRTTRLRAVGRRQALGRDQRRRLNDRLGRLERQAARLRRYFLDRLADGASLDEPDYAEMVSAIKLEEEQRRRRLEAELPAPSAGTARELGGSEELRKALSEVLSIGVPRSPDRRVQRAALVSCLLDRVTISDGGDGCQVLLEGTLAPSD